MEEKQEGEEVRQSVNEELELIVRVKRFFEERAGTGIGDDQSEALMDVTFDVFPPVNSFTGRSKELSDLHDLVLRRTNNGAAAEAESVTIISQMTSVSGLGGIGKTQLARKYIQENQKHFNGNCIWLNAETEASLSESFRRLATDVLGLSTKNGNDAEKSIQSVVADVYKVFDDSGGKNNKALFVFDNAERLPWLRNFLPNGNSKRGNIHILMTSRDQEWEMGMEVLKLTELSMEEAVNFVGRGLKLKFEKEVENIKMLANRLQCFPLALQQAVSFIQQQQTMMGDDGYSIEDYLKGFEKMAKVKMLQFRDPNSIQNDYTETTFTTWNISTEKIAQDNEYGELALYVLNIMAYMNPTKIRRDFFYNLIKLSAATTEELGVEMKVKVDKEKVNYAVKLLIKYSIINGEYNQSILSIHRMVQEVTRINLGGKEEEEKFLKVLLGLLLNGPMRTENVEHALIAWENSWKYPNLILSHMQMIPSLLKKMDDVGMPVEAVRFGKEFLRKVELCFGGEAEQRQREREYLQIEVTLPSILSRQGKFSEALEISEMILKKANEDSLITLSAQTNIAGTLSLMGKFEETSKLQLEIYAKLEKLLGPEHEHTLHIQHGYAFSLQCCGRLDEALEIYESLLKKYEKIHEEKFNVEVLRVRKNAAKILNIKENFKEAVKVFKDIYERMAPIWKENVYLFAIVCINFGNSLSKTGKGEEALRFLRQNYEKVKPLLGNEHFIMLIFLRFIGDALTHFGEAEEALKMHQMAYQGFIKTIGEEHWETLSAKRGMANALLVMGRNQESIFILREVLNKISGGGNGNGNVLDGNNSNYSYFLVVFYAKRDLALAIERSSSSMEEKEKGLDLEEALELHKHNYEQILPICGEDSPCVKGIEENIKRIENKIK